MFGLLSCCLLGLFDVASMSCISTSCFYQQLHLDTTIHHPPTKPTTTKLPTILLAQSGKPLWNKRRNEVDYRTEIPFQRHAPLGFYAVDDEKAHTQLLSLESNGRDFEVQRMDQIEARRRDCEEEQAQKRDRTSTILTF